MSLLTMENVSYKYGGTTKTILKRVSAEFNSGKSLSQIDRDKYRAESIGVIFQGYNLLTNATADEPSDNLDHDTEENILAILTSLAHNEGKCVIIVTHSKKVASIADEVWGMKDGNLTLVK